MQRAALASLLFLSMLLTPAHAQRDTTARLTGTVRSSINGLLVSGVQVRCRVGQCLPLASDGGRLCVMSLFLDGVRMPADYLNLARVDELAGVEVYKVPVEVPPEFSSGLRRSCGAVVMWSRR